MTPPLGIKVDAIGAGKVVYFNFIFWFLSNSSIWGCCFIFFALEIFGLYLVSIVTISVLIVSFICSLF